MCCCLAEKSQVKHLPEVEHLAEHVAGPIEPRQYVAEREIGFDTGLLDKLVNVNV
jgi:hypothetical protein